MSRFATDANAARIVLDTNACLDLFVFNDSRCAKLWAALRDQRLRAVTRADCRDEWMGVLARPQLALSDALRAHAASAYDRWVTPAVHVGEGALSRLPRCADADDQKFLELAQSAAATALISRDRALLVLSKRTLKSAGFIVLAPEQVADWLNA